MFVLSLIVWKKPRNSYNISLRTDGGGKHAQKVINFKGKISNFLKNFTLAIYLLSFVSCGL